MYSLATLMGGFWRLLTGSASSEQAPPPALRFARKPIPLRDAADLLGLSVPKLIDALVRDGVRAPPSCGIDADGRPMFEPKALVNWHCRRCAFAAEKALKRRHHLFPEDLAQESTNA